MATFTFLTPQSIPIVGVNCLGRCNKGPNCRVLNKEGAFIEASMVRSVEKVVQLLQMHLNLDINVTSADVLRLNYEGNVHLRNGQVDSAIDCYDAALALKDKEQEGVLLVMRGTALLQRVIVCITCRLIIILCNYKAYGFKMRHKDSLGLADEVLPNKEVLLSLCNSLQRLQPIFSLDLLLRTSLLYHTLDNRWESIKQKWPETVSLDISR